MARANVIQQGSFGTVELALHFAAASFSRSARLTLSDAQTIYVIPQQCWSILVPSYRLRVTALLSFCCRATIESLSSVHSSSTVAKLPHWMPVANVMSTKFKAFSFPVINISYSVVLCHRKSDLDLYQSWRIRFASGPDPPLDQAYYSGFDTLPRKRSAFALVQASILSRKITSCQDGVWFFNTSRTFYITLNFATHGNRLPDNLQLPPPQKVSSRNACMCKPQASNAEQSKEVCHQGWCFTLHNQVMNA